LEPPLPSREYYESLWSALPRDAQPAMFERRRAFLLDHIDAGERVLDAGCGDGAFLAELAAAGALPVGIEIAEEPLRRAADANPGAELHRVPIDGPWPLADSSFDAVWAGEVIEHVADTARWLSEARRVLRSGGRLLLSTPAHDPLTRIGLALLPRRFDAHFDPRGDHLRFYTRRTLRELLQDMGFEEVRLRGAGGLPGAPALLLASARRARF
jgi:SAM-dependent methyltransferase